MPTQYSSYDRCFDQGHTEIRSTSGPSIGRKVTPKSSGKKLRAFAVVGVVLVMIASGFAMMAPRLGLTPEKTVQKIPENSPAGIAIGGTHYVNVSISNMFEDYLKVTNSTGGHQTGGMGLNDWWTVRGTTYGDVVIRSVYPYIIGYNPYSAEIPPNGVSIPTMTYGLYSFYRVTIDAPSTTTIGTGPNTPLGFIPILGTPWTTYSAMSGGWVNWSYYLTYCTSGDIALAQAGTGYMNTYYGVTPAQFNFGGSNGNDGWYVDFQGKADFNRAAAKKFLGLTGSASLITQFNANNTGANLGKMNASWSTFWTNDGSNVGYNDTYASYDYSLSYAPLSMFLMVDQAKSTADKLVLRIYGIVWGVENLMQRYLDRAGIWSKSIPSIEDWYLNGTASSNGADVHCRMGCVYSVMAWKDTGFFSPCWYLDTLHADYTPNTASHIGSGGHWTSRYNIYTPTKTFKPTYMDWSPGTLNYAVGCAYWFPPMNWSLNANEKLVIKLPGASTSMMGYTPYKGAGASDTLTAAKQLELQSHTVWGEIGFGRTYPASLYSATYYDSATKTLTLSGPMTFARNKNVAFPNLNATGAPSFCFDLMRVSTYDVTLPTMDHLGTYTATITAKNVTGATVTDWNGTVTLSTVSLGINFGGSSSVVLHFSPSMNGVTTTPVTVTTLGSKSITSTDLNNSLDISDTKTFTVTPEFPGLLIPVIGIMAAVIITLGRRDKKKDKQ